MKLLLIVLLALPLTANAQTCFYAPTIYSVTPDGFPTISGSLLILVDVESQCPDRTLWANARIWHGYYGPCYLDPDFCVYPDTLSAGGQYAGGQVGMRHFALLWDTTRWANGDYPWTLEVHDQFDANSGVNRWVHIVNPAPLPDTQPPQAWLQYPYDGFQMPNGKYASQPLQLLVADNVGVSQVDLLDNGTQIASSTTQPFAFSYNPKTHGTHVLQLRAWDAAGNIGYSNTATVTK
jgi:hypothetical protein